MAETEARRRTILLVDDDAALRRLVEVTLADDDYVILHAACGAEALATARAHRPDLLLLDVHMPGVPDGLEVCRQLKADPTLASTTVIMLTATCDEELQRRALAYGAADYIVKPFSPLMLLRRLEALFDAR
ncbi:MAG: response regulator [Chloroflexi bacterium]|nr:response regulator [Chloroflexota bacterium]